MTDASPFASRRLARRQFNREVAGIGLDFEIRAWSYFPHARDGLVGGQGKNQPAIPDGGISLPGKPGKFSHVFPGFKDRDREDSRRHQEQGFAEKRFVERRIILDILAPAEY